MNTEWIVQQVQPAHLEVEGQDIKIQKNKVNYSWDDGEEEWYMQIGWTSSNEIDD